MGGIKLNTKSFIERAQMIHGNKYDYSKADYIDNQTKIKVICNVHGEFEIRPAHHITAAKRGCKFCTEGGRLYTQNSFLQKIFEIYGNEYDFSLVEFKHIQKPVKIICKKHGIIEMLPCNLLKGVKCLQCYKNETRPTIEQIIKKFKKMHGEKYDYSLIDYKNNYTPIKIICKKHGQFEQDPYHHNHGHGCPQCNHSHGEAIIATALQKLNIQFEVQKKFDECFSQFKRPLRFDFYLPEKNICIEYDGPQHFKMSTYFGQKAFENTKLNDEIKNKFCINKQIKLIRIPYIDKNNIYDILKEELK